MQRGLSATYPVRISPIFETTDLNRCPGGDWREKCLNFYARSFAGPKNAIGGACTERTDQSS